MRLRDAMAVALGGAMLVLIATFAVRIAERYPGVQAEMGRVKLTSLSESTRATLRSLDEQVLITYYASSRESMPSSMRQIERNVTDLLEAMKRAAGGKLDYQVVNPDRDPSFVAYAAHQRVAPYRVRTVTRDAYDEMTVWSTLHLSMGTRRPAVINGIGTEFLPRLQTLIVGQIEQMIAPRRPVIALSAPDHYRHLHQQLARSARIVPIELERGEAIPADADLLFWMEPGDVTAGQVRALREFLDRGRSVVVAGSRHEIEVEGQGVEQEFTLAATDFDAQTLLSAFGLRPIDGLVLDEMSQPVPGEVAPRPARFFVRCIGANQDFREMRSMPNGNLLFAAPTPFALDGGAIAERGYSATVLATTSDRTAITDVKYGPLDLHSTALFTGDPVPKLPLMVWLRPTEPWRGSIVFAASTSPFRDGMLRQGNFAHPRLVDVLLAALASDERLVVHRAGIDAADPLPELSPTARIAWRVVCITLIPALLILVAVARGVFRPERATQKNGGTRLRNSRSSAGTQLAAAGIMAIMLAIGISSVATMSGMRLDLTENGANKLTTESRAITRSLPADNPLEVELIFSRDRHLPPPLRPQVRRLRDLLRAFERSGGTMSVRRLHPEDLNAAEREKLRVEGVEPIRVTTTSEEVTTVRTVYSTARLRLGDCVELLHFPTVDAFEHLEFRVAFAMHRLLTGRRPHIAFASDVPRLTAAEVYHDYQQKQLMAPTGTDVYSQARALLAGHDFRITHVNPQSPQLPDDADLVIWLQPRRSILPMLEAVSEALQRGTPVFIAGQHFNMQARQFRGAGFETVYWPQPQVLDLDLHYLPDLGVEFVREILFDELKSSMELITHVNREADQRDYEQQTSALPFLVRASTKYFADHPMMRGLGDQMLPFPCYIALDSEKLARNGLRATPLMMTSPRTWTFNWEGGWIPDATLDGPPRDDDGRQSYEGERLLAVEVEGAFPPPSEALTDRRVDERTSVDLGEGAGVPARLVLMGNSYLFRNERLSEREFRSDHLLLNIASHLALDPDLATIMTHRLVPPSLAYVEPETRLQWRLIVVAAGPVAMLMFAVGWAGLRRRVGAGTLALADMQPAGAPLPEREGA